MRVRVDKVYSRCTQICVHMEVCVCICVLFGRLEEIGDGW